LVLCPELFLGALFTKVKFTFLKSAQKDSIFHTQFGLFGDKNVYLTEAIFENFKVKDNRKRSKYHKMFL
jgi:hypothetical protein